MNGKPDTGIWAVIVTGIPHDPMVTIKPVIMVSTPIDGGIVAYVVWEGALRSTRSIRGGGRHTTLFDAHPTQAELDACINNAIEADLYAMKGQENASEGLFGTTDSFGPQ